MVLCFICDPALIERLLNSPYQRLEQIFEYYVVPSYKFCALIHPWAHHFCVYIIEEMLRVSEGYQHLLKTIFETVPTRLHKA
jgi:hypothetical protein